MRGPLDPEVGGTGIEVNDESLVVGTDRDRTSPFDVIVLVGEGFPLTLLDARRDNSKGLDLGTLVEGLTTLVTFKVDQVLAVLANRVEQERLGYHNRAHIGRGKLTSGS